MFACLPCFFGCASSCLLSAVCCLLSAVCCLLSAVCCLLSAVCCLLLTPPTSAAATYVPAQVAKDVMHTEFGCLTLGSSVRDAIALLSLKRVPFEDSASVPQFPLVVG